MKKTLMAAGFVLFSFMLPLKASAANYGDIYVFGDSISDTGNAFAASGNTFPPYPYYFNGRFTNGYNWIDEFAKRLNIDSPTPYFNVANGVTPNNGINFAFGGATTTPANTVTNAFFGLPQEISAFQSYLNQTQQVADPDALYIFWLGANDYLPTDSKDFVPFTTPNQTLANISNALQTIAGLGAKNLLVVNLPNLGNTPLGLSLDKSIPGTSSGLNTLTQEHNNGLSQIIKELNANPALDLNIISLDVNPILDNITKLGFTNTTEPCFNKITLTICANPDKYLYWDEIHPTARAHKIFAGAALAAIPEPSPALGMIALGALGAAGVLKRRQKKSTVTIENRE
ncbi:SGNH/GDSL hydrolase family protein [Nostoc sp. CENA67]|uniref:SGNH/GDSL hydrolase family protein n=1 Tax=Amazonocrinis nigriterrae CENA67 TaxID=2794033 RepID=A0A8J7HXY5_9NOST|nr:SGNH/GDSL hydrolase family protein [Amazonocrinis nigriterrae]MBH8565412.1 SGNH/GDSL hydrolase family protein [Amazonocrinis nigriterrae CENA67]